MIKLGRLRDLRTEVQAYVDRLTSLDWWQTQVVAKADETTRAVLAGIGLREARAILRGDEPTERPNPRYKAHVKSFVLHIRPKYYQRGSTWFTHTFRLGFFSTFFFIVETITGLILMIFYSPTPATAYSDMLNILSNVPFGRFMRDLHRLGAELMVATVALHMLRVYLTGSYKHPRQFTWLTGVVLLIVTAFLSFSGYLLPWDQLAYWAVTIGTSMADAAPVGGTQANLLLRGAPDIGAGGLLRFYLLHILLLPLLAIIFISVHYYKVAREHSISLPAVVEEGNLPPEEKKRAEERVDLIPDLLTHEIFLVALGIFLMSLLVTTGYHAPLEHHANPQRTPFHTKAPWYFLWIQGLLKLGDKTLMGVVLPTAMVLLLFAVPYIDRNPSRLARNRPIAIFLGIVGVVVMLMLSYMGTPGWGIAAPPQAEIFQALAPEEGEGIFQTSPGPIRELGYDGLPVGMYDVDEFVVPENPTEFEKILGEFKSMVIEAFGEGAQATMIVEPWQQNLKRVTMEIDWEDPAKKPEDTIAQQTIYVHREAKHD
ncbi:MAG: cytochrome bc complex cytochrome b subunit [Chloroflexi bacterium]|nr:MAG: cytochrome bc complex cytochrome b subunit [Chloroflexota bacterium]